MIIDWTLQDVAVAAGIIGSVQGLVVWMLKKKTDEWYEPKAPIVSEADKAQNLDAMARKVLATPVLHEYTASTVSGVLRSGDFWDATVAVVVKDKGIQEFVDGRCQHANLSHESAIRIIMADATKAVGDQLQKSLTDSQAMFMAELRGIRSDLAEGMKSIGEQVAELNTDLQVHKAEDRARRPG